MIFDKFLDAVEGTLSLIFNCLKQLQLLMVDYHLSGGGGGGNGRSLNTASVFDGISALSS